MKWFISSCFLRFYWFLFLIDNFRENDNCIAGNFLGIYPGILSGELDSETKKNIDAIKKQYGDGTFERTHKAFTDTHFGAATHELARYL